MAAASAEAATDATAAEGLMAMPPIPVMPEGWKPGDPIPMPPGWMPGDAVPMLPAAQPPTVNGTPCTAPQSGIPHLLPLYRDSVDPLPHCHAN